MVPRITLPLYDSKSIKLGVKPPLYDMPSYNGEKAPLYDTTVINTPLYYIIVHDTLYQLSVYHMTVLFQRYI